MDKRTEFNSALKEALKAKDQTALSTIRLILAALKDRDIAARGQGNPDGIAEADILAMLQSMIKQRRESIKMYREGNREELAAQEEAEIAVIERFLPAQLDAGALKAIIEAAIAATNAQDIKDMGKIMAVLKTNYAGQIDMGKAGALVKDMLG